MGKLKAHDFHLLHYFAVAAEEGNFQRAAKRLHMTQPPLSRQIARLEDVLGYALFKRLSYGVELTEAGLEILKKIEPLLQLQKKTFDDLENYGINASGAARIGLSTAFEQGIFYKLEKALYEHCNYPRIVRKSSPQLARDIERGSLDAAIIALPLATGNFSVHELEYWERLSLFMPELWDKDAKNFRKLCDLNGRPLFWFKRMANPAWFDHMRVIFNILHFVPRFIEEPEGHDVLLARIAAGEGMAIMPKSFTMVKRDNIVCKTLCESSLLSVHAGIIYTCENKNVKKFVSLVRLHMCMDE